MTKSGGIAADQLKSIIERVERLEEEKSGLASDIKDIFAEAKGNGKVEVILMMLDDIKVKKTYGFGHKFHFLIN